MEKKLIEYILHRSCPEITHGDELLRLFVRDDFLCVKLYARILLEIRLICKNK
jgi:hypothetical protein